MAPTNDCVETRYSVRIRDRMVNSQKKYDDIFTSVVEKVLSTDQLRMSPPPHYRMPTKLKPIRRKKLAWKPPKPKNITWNGAATVQRQQPQPRQICMSARAMGMGEEDVSSENSSDGSCSSNTNSSVEEDTVDKQVKQVNFSNKSFACQCGMLFEKHRQLHEHLALEHAPVKTSFCTKCGVNVKALRNTYVCRICGIFSPTLEEHMRAHYQDRTGHGALMECRHCYRSFTTIHDVREHEKVAHGVPKFKPPPRYRCNCCSAMFDSRYTRDTHLVNHFETELTRVWSKIGQMQQTHTDQLLVNQCPVCYSVMGSRKSFRLHIIHRHLLQNPRALFNTLGLPDLEIPGFPMSPDDDLVEVKKEPVDPTEQQGILEEIIRAEPYFGQVQERELKKEPDEASQ